MGARSKPEECASVSALNASGMTGNENGDRNPAAPSLLLRVSPHLVPLTLGLLVRGIPGFQIQKTRSCTRIRFQIRIKQSMQNVCSDFGPSKKRKGTFFFFLLTRGAAAQFQTEDDE